MKEQEFIDGVANGTLLSNDIRNYCDAHDKEWIEGLLNDILPEYLALCYCGEFTCANRLDDACKLICKRYGLPHPAEPKQRDEPQQQPEPQQEQANGQQEQQAVTQQAAAPEGNQEPQQETDDSPQEQQPEAQQGEQNQQNKSMSTRGKGRPKKPFKDMMIIDDADGSKLKKLHQKMQGKTGKSAALVIYAAMKKTWISKPTHTQVTEEFGDIGAQQGFTRYLNDCSFTPEELTGMMNSLD